MISKRTEFPTVSTVLACECFDKVLRMRSIGVNRGMKDDECHSHLFLCAHMRDGLALSSSIFAEVVIRDPKSLNVTPTFHNPLSSTCT